jgi:hypothetical protein
MATTYHEIVIKGDEELLRGFIRGFQIGRSIKGGIWLGRDHPIDKKHLRDILVFWGNQLHVICTAGARRSVIAAIEQVKDLDFKIVSDKRIAKTYFTFDFDTFSRDAASKIKGLFDAIPADIRLLDYAPQEKIDEGAHGVELYSPVHEYQFRGKGRIEGDFETLLSFREKLAANEFIDVKEVEIEH